MEKVSCYLCKKEAKGFNLKDFGVKVCSQCLPEFVLRRTLSTMRSFHMVKQGQTVAVGISGGKDSTALVHVLGRLQKKLGITVKAFHLHLGFADFSEKVLEIAKEAALQASVEFKAYFIKDYGVRVEPIGSFPACAVCGALKRTIFNRIAKDLGAQVLATAHTFDDIFLFALKNLVSKKDNIPKAVLPPANELLPAKIKPFYLIPEYLTRAYCDVLGLKYYDSMCPIADKQGHALKPVFAEIDKVSPGFRKQILDGLKRVFKVAGKKQKEPVFNCRYCGEPATQEICALCRVRHYQAGTLGS